MLAGTSAGAALLAACGGVLGKQIVPVIEDGASDWPTFAEKAGKLLDVEQGGGRVRLLDLGQP